MAGVHLWQTQCDARSLAHSHAAAACLKVFPEIHLHSALPRPTQASRDGEAYQVEVAQTRNSRGALLERQGKGRPY